MFVDEDRVDNDSRSDVDDIRTRELSMVRVDVIKIRRLLQFEAL